MQRLIHTLLMVIALASPVAAAERPVPAPSPKAMAAILMEGRTGQVLWSKNPHLPLAPASTTKIMTALLVLEMTSMNRVVTVSPRASEADGSSIWLEAGERRTVGELVYGALLNSGNDACDALAEAVAGNEAGFAKLMTARARNLGALNTRFMNADGLPASGHLSTAYDLAIIARAALDNPTFASIVRTKVKNIPWPGKDWDRRLINHNKLLWRYEGADGVKTGYTRESGRCLVSSATRGGRQLIAVVLDSPNMYEESAAILDYGFSRYALVDPGDSAARVIPVAGGRVRSITLRPSRCLAYAVPSAQAAAVQLEVECSPRLRAPIVKGQKLGWAELRYDDRLLARVPLVAANTVRPRNLFASIAAFLLRLLA